MRCSGSPTTSTAADCTPRTGGDLAQETGDEREAAEAFQAMLMSTVMKPLSDAMGPLGAVVVDGFARAAINKQRRGDQ
ncbi:MAG: hypothetical protein ACREM6_12050 [Vulcanimicrobiaceae bacterium]